MAVMETYLEELVDEDTGLVDDKLTNVFEYIFTKYGTVLLEEVKEKEHEVLNLTFQPLEAMMILYCPMKQLMNLSTLAGFLYLAAHQI